MQSHWNLSHFRRAYNLKYFYPAADDNAHVHLTVMMDHHSPQYPGSMKEGWKQRNK
jgi:hypothetical protein